MLARTAEMDTMTVGQASAEEAHPMADIKMTGRGPSGLTLDRRELLAGAAALGLSYGSFDTPAFAADTPKKGGTLRLGMEGGSASDSLDPRTYADSIPIS